MTKINARLAVCVVGLCVLLNCAGCLGHNHATGRLFEFNMELENKWAQEIRCTA